MARRLRNKLHLVIQPLGRDHSEGWRLAKRRCDQPVDRQWGFVFISTNEKVVIFNRFGLHTVQAATLWVGVMGRKRPDLIDISTV